MRNAILCVSALLFATAATPSRACSLISPPVAETVNKVAAEGMLISGHVIQAFDVDKNQPEIIRAEQIFVGEGGPRDFVIYRSPRFFEHARKRRDEMRDRNWPPFSCPEPQTYSLGQSFDRLVLVPAAADNGTDLTGKWSIEFWGGSVVSGRALDLLVEESERKGRFQTRPPKSRQWGDCMECGVPHVR
jgi:hypothetical protein